MRLSLGKVVSSHQRLRLIVSTSRHSKEAETPDPGIGGTVRTNCRSLLRMNVLESLDSSGRFIHLLIRRKRERFVGPQQTLEFFRLVCLSLVADASLL